MKKSVTNGTRQSRIKAFFAENYTGWLFILPLMFGIAVFTLYPMIQSMILKQIFSAASNSSSIRSAG